MKLDGDSPGTPVGTVFVAPPMPDGVAVTDFSVHSRQRVDVGLIRLGEHGSEQAGRIQFRAEPLAPGEQVAALGYPSVPQRQPSLALMPGAVQSVQSTYDGELSTIVVSMDLAGGYSGGPVIDRGGRLVGIVVEQTFEAQSSPAVPVQTFSHVLPVSYVRELLDGEI